MLLQNANQEDAANPEEGIIHLSVTVAQKTSGINLSSVNLLKRV